ncbi:YajG family lipoprotein [Desulfolutivibrio sp.]|uniref:YajG family lipoprotein n=1 Tax=Desulfolutivibrio sp. TaxID=2773296 RepID=UPI002F968944
MMRGFFSRTATACVLCAAVLSCAGCGAYRANVACQAVVEKEDLGRDVQVVVLAADARPDATVGQRNPDSKMAGTVVVDSEVAQTLRRAAGDGLVAKGFSPAAPSESVVRTLTVELAALTYAGTPRLGGITAEARVVLDVTVDNNGAILKKAYEASTQWKLNGDNVEPDFDRLLGQTLSKAVSKMAGDYDLLNFLVKTVLRTRDLG